MPSQHDASSVFPRLHVCVDDREARGAVLPFLRAFDDVEVTVARLPVGDYAWEGPLLFERKRLFDFARSVQDGRLFGQAVRLAASERRGVLILEGTARDLARCRMRREALQGALVSITLFVGVPVLRARDPGETARLMHYAARQLRASRDGALRRPAVGRRPRGKRRAQLQLLQGLPGVGPARARRLLQAFGSVEAVCSAGVHELTEVYGIGPATARAIRWVVGEPGAVYHGVPPTR